MTIDYLHFCGGFGAESGNPLRFWEHIAIAAAARLHPTATLMLHTSPGSWSNAPASSIVKYYTEDESSQYTAWRCKHGAHQSDKVRLMALLEYGGLYQDTDSFMLRNCDHLSDYSTCAIPGQSKSPRSQIVNGFIYAPTANDPWLTHLYSELNTLRGSQAWNHSSIELYSRLRRQVPGCTMLDFSKYTMANWHKKDRDFFFGALDSTGHQRVDNCYVAHAIQAGLKYKDKTYLMNNPPPDSVYAYILEKCQSSLN